MPIAPGHYPPPPDPGSSDGNVLRKHNAQLAKSLTQILQGKINCIGSVTLTANAASTVFTDVRLSGQGVAIFDPLTANAAIELAAGTLYCLTANRGEGAWTLTHANAASVDRAFRVLIIS